MRRVIFVSLYFFFCSLGFAQFNYSNNIGVGINVPVLISAFDYIPLPIVQVDYRHEFYFSSRRSNLERSVELRVGVGGMAMLSRYTYMANLGFQYSFVETQYLQALGADLVGFMMQVPRARDQIFDISGIGKGQGAGVGVFYKFGRRLSEHWSITTEVGAMFTMDNYSVSYLGYTVWRFYS